jgi:NAD(P)H-dependent FMN reductase
MSDAPLKIMAVVGSLNKTSVTRAVLQHAVEALQARGCQVDILDFLHEPLALYNPDMAYSAETYLPLKTRVETAEAFLLGTPDYHGSISSALKNFLDHFWHEFAGKLFGTVVASHEKGLTVTDQLRTVARQCYAWSLPYGVSFNEKEDVQEGLIASDYLKNRLAMLVRDLHVYGGLLAQQRNADLQSAEPSFMARWRSSS